MRRLMLVVVLTLAAPACFRDRPGTVSPVVLPDVTGHTALLVDHTGRYELTTEPIRDIGSLPGPQLKISWSLSCYATWRVEAVNEVPVPEPTSCASRPWSSSIRSADLSWLDTT